MKGGIKMTMPMFILAIVIAIVWNICKNNEQKQQNISKYGYCPINEGYDKLSPERKKIVDKMWEDKDVAKQEEIWQKTRKYNENGFAYNAEFSPQSNVGWFGKDNTLPSLESFQKMADRLPSNLGNELIAAARAESLAIARKNTYRAGIDHTPATRHHTAEKKNIDEVAAK